MYDLDQMHVKLITAALSIACLTGCKPDHPAATPERPSGAYRIGGAVLAPSVISKIEPQYSEEARDAKLEGTVVLSLVVDEQGNPKDIQVKRPLGMGLDQKAVEAVQKWRFQPGLKDGKAVPVQATIEVNFRLL